MSKEKDDPASRPDEDSPEWTREDFRRARPALEVIATLRLDPDVLEAFRQEGSGWQTRINEVLRAYMPRRAK